MWCRYERGGPCHPSGGNGVEYPDRVDRLFGERLSPLRDAQDKYFDRRDREG